MSEQKPCPIQCGSGVLEWILRHQSFARAELREEDAESSVLEMCLHETRRKPQIRNRQHTGPSEPKRPRVIRPEERDAQRLGLEEKGFEEIALSTHGMVVPSPPNGWRVSGERRAEGDERVRCTRVLRCAPS